VEASGEPLGAPDLHEWLSTIDAVDQLVDRAVSDGLHSSEAETRFMVTTSGTAAPSALRLWPAGAEPAALRFWWHEW
jgi:hypothetical protein